VEQWIHEAQEQKIVDVMLKILEGDEEVLDILDKAKLPYPYDLHTWAGAPETYISIVKDEVRGGDCSVYIR
jgi:hypothetical protein